MCRSRGRHIRLILYVRPPEPPTPTDKGKDYSRGEKTSGPPRLGRSVGGCGACGRKVRVYTATALPSTTVVHTTKAIQPMNHNDSAAKRPGPSSLAQQRHCPLHKPGIDPQPVSSVCTVRCVHRHQAHTYELMGRKPDSESRACGAADPPRASPRRAALVAARQESERESESDHHATAT